VSQDVRIWERYVPAPEGSFLRWSEDHGIFAMPDRNRARIRRIAATVFSGRGVRRMEEEIRRIVFSASERLSARASDLIDLHAEFTAWVPYAVIGRVVGVDSGGDDARLRRLVRAALEGFVPYSSGEARVDAEQAFGEYCGWLRQLVSRRRASPADDLISQLVHAECDGERLQDDEVVLTLMSVIGAGTVTTSAIARSMILGLLTEEKCLAELRAERGRIREGIDEILRFTTGGPSGPVRFARRAFVLGGRAIREGQMIMASAGGSNRDPDAFPEPDLLSMNRKVNGLLSFGVGPYFCLGASLARSELAFMLEALLDVLTPGARLCAERFEVRRLGLFRSVTNLPVALGR